ncbi:MAG: hypothetical protein H6745_16525 [Deltaproteobacteria bacterium]|nr:hypothetical protein [Deltaproteobacteria bacterium]
MHYLNPTEEDLEVHVTVNATTFAPGESYVPAAAFVTYNTKISIPGGVGAAASAEGRCDVPAGATFFALSTHAHKRSVRTTVHDGDASVLDSTDWEHPDIIAWDAPGYRFTGQLVYRCDYENDRDDAVHSGPSAETDEMCMAIGYFYPADKPVFCINDRVIAF